MIAAQSLPSIREPSREFPRSFRIGNYRVNSYKVFLCVGLYVAILASAAVGQAMGTSPLRLGIALLLCAVVGLAGARLYHLAVYFTHYRRHGFRMRARAGNESGWSVFGGLLIVPFSLAMASLAGVSFGRFWDHLGVAIVVGGPLIRFGCICNGCCVGRRSEAWFARRQHDVHGVYLRRVPVQWLEIFWWIAGCAGISFTWRFHWPPGSYGLAVLAWYGIGRFWLEPLREDPDVIAGRIRINRLVAALVALTAGTVFALNQL